MTEVSNNLISLVDYLVFICVCLFKHHQIVDQNLSDVKGKQRLIPRPPPHQQARTEPLICPCTILYVHSKKWWKVKLLRETYSSKLCIKFVLLAYIAGLILGMRLVNQLLLRVHHLQINMSYMIQYQRTTLVN